MENNKLNVALVGLKFGASFMTIWEDHPMVNKVYVCDKDPEAIKAIFRLHPKKIEIIDSFEDILKNDSIDAVHLVTPIFDHVSQTLAVLEAGKHCACTVPMATTVDEINQICAAVKKSGKNYMMMETTLYSYHYIYVQKLLKKGEMGRVQFLRGCHYQDMENWPPYWNGLPPFWYGTHAIAPMIGIAGSRIDRVSCLGSGTMRKELVDVYQNPFPLETALFHFENGLAGEATRSLFETARGYKEGLAVYGSKKTFEWGQLESDPCRLTALLKQTDPNLRGSKVEVESFDMKAVHETLPLPKELEHYTKPVDYDATNPQLADRARSGGGHHGSHVYLVHEFVQSIVENRKPWIDETLAGNITAAGICAHESALKGGEWITVPEFC